LVVKSLLGGAGLDVRVVEALDAAVEVADAACGGVLPQKLDGGADGKYEEGEGEALRKHRFFAESKKLRREPPMGSR
jgi:hypothetical protein